MPRIVLIDGMNMFIRNYAIVPSLSSTSGERTGGVYGTLRSISSSIKTLNPDKIIFVWDGPGGSKKKRKIIPSYKEGRRPLRLNKNFSFENDNAEENKKYQQKRLMSYFNDLPLYQIFLEDIEADDIIGYLVKYYTQHQKIIVSNDRDFYQLLDEKTIIYAPIKNACLNKKIITKEYKIHPKNFVLARSIIGDKSDNLVGVKGVGFKTIIKFFSFLKENREIKLEEIFDISKKEGKKYQKFLDSRQIIENNYAVMQLKDPLIGIININKIHQSLDKKVHFNRINLRTKLQQDGISQLGEDFFRNFKLLQIREREYGTKI